MSQIKPQSPVPVTSPAPTPPDAPRMITRRASRRAWVEPRVRFWWLMAIGLFLVGGNYAFTELYNWREQVYLIKQGIEVQAVPYSGEGSRIANQKLPPGTRLIMEFTLNGKAYKAPGYMAEKGEYILTGIPMTIRVDPENPMNWTWRTEPVPLVKQLLLLAIILPAALILLGLAVLFRNGFIKCWKNGTAVSVVVIDSHQSALAPRSKLVNCRPMNSADRREFRVFIPIVIAKPQRGDNLWLIAATKRSSHAIFADAYIER